MKINTGVFDRTGRNTLGKRSFYASLGFSTIWGLLITAFLAWKMAEIGHHPGAMEIIGLGLIVPIIGIFMANGGNNPVSSFLGYNMITVPFGIVLAPLASHYSPNIIYNAFSATAITTGVMIIAGTIFPNFFSRIGGALLVSLFGLLIVRIFQLFIPELMHFRVIDWIAAAIFSLYIGYDWYRASKVQRTVTNAINISIDLYLDIINLFLTFLRNDD